MNGPGQMGRAPSSQKVEIDRYVAGVTRCTSFDELKEKVDLIKEDHPDWFEGPAASDMNTDIDLLSAVIVKVEGLYYEKINDPANTSEDLESIKNEIMNGGTWASGFIGEARKKRFKESFEALAAKS